MTQPQASTLLRCCIAAFPSLLPSRTEPQWMMQNTRSSGNLSLQNTSSTRYKCVWLAAAAYRRFKVSYTREPGEMGFVAKPLLRTARHAICTLKPATWACRFCGHNLEFLYVLRRCSIFVLHGRPFWIHIQPRLVGEQPPRYVSKAIWLLEIARQENMSSHTDTLLGRMIARRFLCTVSDARRECIL